MSRTVWRVVFMVSLAVFIVLALKIFNPTSPAPQAEEPLLIYCAAGLRQAVEDAAKSYGHDVRLQFGGSQTLLANAEMTKKGDLYIPADDSYLAIARSKKLIAEAIPLARMTPVLAVAKGNPKGVHGLADLLKPDVRLAQANPDTAAVGKLVRGALEKQGAWEALKTKTLVFKPTVNDVANDLKLGSADAAFVWDTTVRQYPDLERVAGVDFGVTGSVSVAVLSSSPAPAAALRFARYLSAPDRGLVEFAKNGFETLGGDPWAETPALLLYAGAMLRPAIEKTVAAFEAREGCTVTRVYNGCGILIGQMEAGGKPDLYFACDAQFLAQVKEKFLPALEVSQNQLVILIPKGNPKGIRTLRDLAKPGVRVGVGHEKQCALGKLTQETLVQSKLESEVMKNVVVQAPTGDMLVNQLRTGSLDAVVAYVSNGVSAADVLEALPIDVPCALAVQPVAVAKAAAHPKIAARLIEALRSAESRARFEAEGFTWRAHEPR
ncbi:MAG TPA: molybdate ABC transporter substrate-binding protein [Planctomycetota bacterium]|nr:molybdate ABC transporter substrate-binding protein [Planctomycetota bacterium]